jgi:hypothetical protein
MKINASVIIIFIITTISLLSITLYTNTFLSFQDAFTRNEAKVDLKKEQIEKDKQIGLKDINIKNKEMGSEKNSASLKLESKEKIIIESAEKPFNDGFPGKTLAEIESLQKYESDLLKDESKIIAIEANEDHAAVTLKELRQLHEKEKLQIEKNLKDPNFVVLSDDQQEITVARLNELHESEKKEIENTEDQIEVFDTNAGEPFLTLAELKRLHSEEAIKIAEQEENDTERSDLKLLKQKENYQILEESFNPNKLIVEE